MSKILSDLLCKFFYCFSCISTLGWEDGAGLGLQEQGIQEPIKAGEVRDKKDKYKVCGSVFTVYYIIQVQKIDFISQQLRV